VANAANCRRDARPTGARGVRRQVRKLSLRKPIFNKTLEKAGLRRIRIHDLRHTYGSLLIQKGESLPYIKDQLGYHSIKVTVHIYGHLVPGGNKEAVDGLDDDATIRNLYATNKEKELTASG